MKTYLEAPNGEKCEVKVTDDGLIFVPYGFQSKHGKNADKIKCFHAGAQVHQVLLYDYEEPGSDTRYPGVFDVGQNLGSGQIGNG